MAKEVGLATDKWAFYDVFGFDKESLKHVPQPVLALILLFPFSQVNNISPSTLHPSLTFKQTRSDIIKYK